ncbi:MAG: cell surface protein SprA, partial [Bacteroidetes bacterium]
DENTKGTLYINLGNISEDILRDSYRTFENGLPKTEEEATDLTKDTLSNWGRVPPPEYQAIVPNFDSDPTTREFQDVGLDGFRDEEERSFFQKVGDKVKSLFGETSLAYQKFLEDPSADDYNFYRDDDFDQEELNILERYKKYNGLEGNSPTSEQSQKENKDGYPTAATQLPDVEDINNDGNMNEIEQYYQYKIEISPQTINPSMVGQGYLNDMLETTVKTKNGEERVVRWYQFRIPIESYEKAVGGISDFRSIRFMRMFLRGFKQPVFLRFATLDLVRGEWRRYTDNKLSVGEHTNEDQDEYLNFDVGAVNIEQNGSKQPVNYVLPPGIFRQQNFSTTSIILQNEQSMSYDICGLKDGEEAAAYRNFDVNAIAYKKMKLFFHAEQAGEEYPLNDGDLHAFIRFGSDFEDNYYEYEIPLKVTPWGQYNNDNEDDRRLVWPSENEVEIIFEEFVNLKKQRNMETYAEGGVLFSNTFVQRYSAPDPNNPQNTMIVVGNPNLTQLKVIMIGVRNPSKATNPENDDGQPKCAEIWINELRLADFEEKGGWGAIGQANLKLADFANISLAGSMKTPGFGSIEQKVLERLRETIQTVDINTTVQLGKLLPDNAKVRLPMFVGYSNNVSTPQYDPVQQDVLFKDHLTSFETREQRDSVKQASRTQIERKSLNFTNVRKEKSGKKSKSHFYDISNFSATYAYTEETFSDINTHHDLKKTYRGGLSYAFSAQPKNYKPFSSIGFIKKSKYLK